MFRSRECPSSAARAPGARGGTPWNERPSPRPAAVHLRRNCGGSPSSSPITPTGFAGSLSRDRIFNRAGSQSELDADSIWRYLPPVLRSGHIRWGMLPSRKTARARISPVLTGLRSRIIIASRLDPASIRDWMLLNGLSSQLRCVIPPCGRRRCRSRRAPRRESPAAVARSHPAVSAACREQSSR